MGKESGYSFVPGAGFSAEVETARCAARHRKWRRASDALCCPGVMQVQVGREEAKGWCSVIKG